MKRMGHRVCFSLPVHFSQPTSGYFLCLHKSTWNYHFHLRIIYQYEKSNFLNSTMSTSSVFSSLLLVSALITHKTISNTTQLLSRRCVFASLQPSGEMLVEACFVYLWLGYLSLLKKKKKKKRWQWSLLSSTTAKIKIVNESCKPKSILADNWNDSGLKLQECVVSTHFPFKINTTIVFCVNITSIFSWAGITTFLLQALHYHLCNFPSWDQESLI